jgi:phosphoglycolate phosphatase
MDKEIKLVIFDLDGTLIDAYTAIEKSFNYVMRRLGLKPQNVNTVRRLVGWGDINLLKPYFSPKDLKGALGLYRNHHKHSLLKYSHLYPYVRGLLRGLKARGYKLAVASNRPSRFSRILLKHLKINGFFDYVLCADQARHPKPHPDMLNRIVNKFKFKKVQALYVGDMAIDACAGRAAKIKTVIVTGGSSSNAEIKKEKPFKVIGAIRYLKRLV